MSVRIFRGGGKMFVCDVFPFNHAFLRPHRCLAIALSRYEDAWARPGMSATTHWWCTRFLASDFFFSRFHWEESCYIALDFFSPARACWFWLSTTAVSAAYTLNRNGQENRTETVCGGCRRTHRATIEAPCGAARSLNGEFFFFCGHFRVDLARRRRMPRCDRGVEEEKKSFFGAGVLNWALHWRSSFELREWPWWLAGSSLATRFSPPRRPRRPPSPILRSHLVTAWIIHRCVCGAAITVYAVDLLHAGKEGMLKPAPVFMWKSIMVFGGCFGGGGGR